MKIAVVEIRGAAPYASSKCISPEEYPPSSKEKPDDYEKRAWRGRAHIGKDGVAFVPGISFQKALAKAASMLSEKIPGRRNATWTKHFVSGVAVKGDLSLKVKKDDIQFEQLFVPSDGTPGGGKRVWKYFPTFQEWGGQIEFVILDDLITREVFERHLNEAGNLIGVGFWRPERGGLKGRFSATVKKWSEM
jgi:hypothetical protein